MPDLCAALTKAAYDPRVSGILLKVSPLQVTLPKLRVLGSASVRISTDAAHDLLVPDTDTAKAVPARHCNNVPPMAKSPCQAVRHLLGGLNHGTTP